MVATSLRIRVMIQELAGAGLADRQIARQLGVSPPTVRKWRRRGQRHRSAGLISEMGRPVRGAMSTFPAKFADPLRTWRTAHPGWGAKTLYVELHHHPAGYQAPPRSCPRLELHPLPPDQRQVECRAAATHL
mgnify:CR=1 FL=1